MRVLLDQECAAVAGGSPFADAEALDPREVQEACEETMTAVAAANGAVAGAIVGTGAGGVGAIPGAIGGFTAGAAIGEVLNGPYCRWVERKKQGTVTGPGGGSSAAWSGKIVHQFGEVTEYGRHQLMVAPMEEI